jgi:hypothetical protein
MSIEMIDCNGPPEAMHCAAIFCDHCRKPIHKEGNVLWYRRVPSEDGAPVLSPFFFVHKGCDAEFVVLSVLLREYEEEDGWIAARRDIGDFLAQLSYNYETPFEDEDGLAEGTIEFVAPASVGWRIGRRRSR